MTNEEIAAVARASGEWAGRNLTASTVAYHLEMLSHEMGRMRFTGGTRDALHIDQAERAILFAIFGLITSASPLPNDLPHSMSGAA